MKKWEGAKSVSSSTIVVEDNKKMMSLGPRAIKQLTGTFRYNAVINLFFPEEQQLKLAMARSMQEDEDDDLDENEIVELDSQTDYMNKMVRSGQFFPRQTFFRTRNC